MASSKQIIGTLCSGRNALNPMGVLVVPPGKQITISSIIIANYSAQPRNLMVWVERKEDWWIDTNPPEAIQDAATVSAFMNGQGGGLVVPFASVEANDSKYLTIAATLGPYDKIHCYFVDEALEWESVFVSFFGSVEDRTGLTDVEIPNLDLTVPEL